MKQYIQTLIFLILTFAFSPLFLLAGFFRSSNCKKILVIQTAKLGDLVCSTPVFREIKKKYHNSYLIIACLRGVAPVLENNPHVNQIVFIDDFIYGGFFQKLKFIFKIKKEKINCSFTLLPGLLGAIAPIWSLIPKKIITTSKYANKSYKILSVFFKDKLEYKRHSLTIEHYLKLLKFINIDKTSQKKELFFSPKDKEAADKIFIESNLRNQKIIGVSVTAGNRLKEWAPEKFARLFDRLINDLNVRIVIFETKENKEIIEYIQSKMDNKVFNAAGLLTIPQLTAFLEKVDLFVSVDTGPLYMANALGVPVVDIAGPIDIYEQPPLGDKCIIVQRKIECLPCSFAIPPARVCHNKEKLKCLKLITVDNVYQAVKKGLTLTKI